MDREEERRGESTGWEHGKHIYQHMHTKIQNYVSVSAFHFRSMPLTNKVEARKATTKWGREINILRDTAARFRQRYAGGGWRNGRLVQQFRCSRRVDWFLEWCMYSVCQTIVLFRERHKYYSSSVWLLCVLLVGSRRKSTNRYVSWVPGKYSFGGKFLVSSIPQSRLKENGK